MSEERERALRRTYALDGAKYGDSEAGYARWLDELEDRFFGRASRDPRRLRPDERDGAPASASREVRPR